MSSVRLYCGTRKGLFVLESHDSRADWTVSGPALTGWEVQHVCYDDRADPRLFSAVGHVVYGPTVHRSDDGGATWDQVEASPSYAGDRELNRVWTVVTGPADAPETLDAALEAALAHDGPALVEVVTDSDPV